MMGRHYIIASALLYSVLIMATVFFLIRLAHVMGVL